MVSGSGRLFGKCSSRVQSEGRAGGLAFEVDSRVARLRPFDRLRAGCRETGQGARRHMACGAWSLPHGLWLLLSFEEQRGQRGQG